MEEKKILKEISSLRNSINDLYGEIESLEFNLNQKILEEKTDLEFQIKNVEQMVREALD
ncbi:hypothetical protein ACQV2T_08340 [Facklamia sp. P13069]|uniref:hypothetical protein n=1 Tax=Facklamia sp. P13069 TaxID=3421954 RepID=UPI003D180C52